GHRVAGLGDFPELAAGAFDKFEIARLCRSAGASGNLQRRGSLRIGGYNRLHFLRGNVVADPDPAWKPRHSGVREFLVTEGHRGPGSRRVFAFAVAEAGADGEFRAVG